ncbi:MAG: DNA polymerase I [Thermodesulfovibrionales bacterium]
MNLYLIDGNSYVYRAFYAIRGLQNSKGFPTNAIYGFTNMLLKIIKEKRPDGIAISFDSPVPTERHRLFEAYKAQRPETPGDLVRQLPYIRKIIDALNIKVFEIPGYEADDILCTIAKKASEKGIDVFIVTADKDMLQIINEKINIYDPMKDRILNSDYVKERYGVTPERIPELMALSGDTVDNIPGVKGIGEKTAQELLKDFASLNELIQHPEKIKKERIRNLIKENIELIKLSRELAIIKADVPLEFDTSEFAVKEPKWQDLLTLFRDLEFVSLMKLIPTTEVRREYETIMRIDELNNLINSIDKPFAIDIETTGRDTIRDIIVGLALCADKGKAFYIPFGHLGLQGQINRKEGITVLRKLLENEEIPKIGHNLKFDISFLKKEGVNVKGMLYDTMIASYLLNPNRPNHNLEEVAFEYLSYRKKTFPEVIGKRTSFAEVPIEEATAYASEDAALAYELKEILFPRLEEEGLKGVYREIEMPLIDILIDMEMAGFMIDVDKLRYMSKEIERELESIQRRIYFLSGEEFNINSPKQLSRVLFQSLGLKPGKKTKTGFSTELSVLEELAEFHELPREILNYRSLSKLKSTYTDVLPGLVNPLTGRVHTSFNQTVTATGRLSSSEPNLQNIPVRGEWGRRIREAFIAWHGNLILSADYSQIELRILAHLSNDRNLIDAFLSDTDIHSRTASELFNVDIDSVTQDMRRVAKTVNFGVVYGISPFGLSEALNISREEAKRYIDGYFERHKGVKDYIERTLKEAYESGYVKTMFGRKRPIPELKSKTSSTRQLGERLAINSPIQGTAADIIKIAMINIWRAIREKGLKTRMILQVHDELVFEVPEEEAEEMSKLVRDKMEGVVRLSVPLKIEAGIGKNWAEAHG